MAKDKKATKIEGAGKPYKKDVPCGLSDDAKKGKLERIAEALGDKKEVKAAMKLATSEHRTRINELDKEMEVLREQVATGKELRSVSVVERKDYRKNLVEILRVDTRDVVETREMTTEERQETFPEVPRGKKGQRALPPGEALAAAREGDGEAE